jgi:flagellar protein FliO/FliZ
MDSYALARIFLSLLFVVAMILACAWLARKRYMPLRKTARTPLSVTQRISVGPRGMQVMVIEVENERLVLGVTPGSINVLHTLPAQAPDTVPVAPDTSTPPAHSFSRIFNHLAKRQA